MSKTLRVLILEDTPEDAELSIASLEESGYECLWDRVETREDFLDRLRPGDYDLVLSDYSLPSFDGIEAAKLFAERQLDIPFILVSGTLGEEAAVASLKAGATDFVLKSKLFRLPQVVERALKECEDRRLKKLAEQQIKLQAAALESAANAIVITDRDGLIMFVNQSFIDLTGYTYQEAIGQNPRILNSGKHNDRFYKDLWDTVLSGNVWRGEMVNRRKDGSTFVEEQIITPVLNDEDEITNFIAIKQDVTERRRIEHELSRSQKRYRDLVENAIDIIYTHDLEGNYTSANSAVEDILGYTIEEAVTRNLTDTVAPEHLEKARSMIEELLAGNKVPVTDLEMIAKDGRHVLVEVNPKLMIENGVPVGIQGVARDITERKRAADALKESERRFRNMLQNLRLVAMMLDASGRVTYCNEYFAQLTGWTQEEVMGADWFETFLPRQEIDELRIVYSGLVAGDRDAWHHENEIVTKSGERRLIRWNNSVLASASGEIIGTASIGEDITDQKHLEQQFLQAQKMEGIGLLAGGIAHDFNNLLTAINGYSDLTLRKMASDDPLRKNIEQVKDAGLRAAALTSQLLAFSRRQVLKPTVHNVNTVIENQEKMLRRIIRENIELKTVLDPKLGNIRADPIQIEQVIMNLAINARDAMAESGTLTIETQNADLDAEYVSQHLASKTGRYVKITVTDTGSGMDKMTQQRIFEPFFTTKDVGKGTGLGLSTVFGIVKQSGGDITVYSEVGHGTVFKIYLPCVDEDIEKSLWVDEGDENLSGTETILLVEDEEVVRNLVREILVTRGYKVLEASGGKAALKIFETYPDKIHLMLTDVIMPKMSGGELRDKAIVLRPDIKVVFMSGYTDESISDSGILRSGAAFIEKPFSPDRLARKIRHVLQN